MSTHRRVVLRSEFLRIIRRTGKRAARKGNARPYQPRAPDTESDDEQRVMSTGLVEYFVLAVPDESGVAVICEALDHLIAQGTIRLLDLVVVEHADDRLVVREPYSPAALERPGDVVGTTPGVLSQHDIALAASALPPHVIGVIVVTDDRWAEPLALAVQRAGGHIVGGDRVSARRLAALPIDGPSREGGD
jgi:hypothetical protein